ncbi:hypothetical protein [Methylovulum miyakonense]|uniref:hypothetical protein n=1 Tax=Methylovulum miyakonense TaxID=645578 RepID=UPI0012EB9F5A|nr:hypothetical protein [Methylovulum miyakonense]
MTDNDNKIRQTAISGRDSKQVGHDNKETNIKLYISVFFISIIIFSILIWLK